MPRTRVERNISFDEEKKKYYINLDFGLDEHGSQIKKSKTFSRLTEARKALRAHEAARDRGQLKKPVQTTVAEWLTYWMDAIVRPNRALTTAYGYQQMISNYIVPQLGNIPLQELTPRRIQSYYAYLTTSRGLSSNTARKHHDLLRNALRVAVMQDILLFNPTDRVQSPKIKTPKRSFYDVESLTKLMRAVEGERLELAFKLAGYLGLRREEVCGLKWENIDFQRKTIHVCVARTMAGSAVVEKETKNASSTRLLHMPAELEMLLRRERLSQKENRLYFGEEFHDTGFVIVWPKGEPIRPNYLTERFTKFVKSHNLPPLTLHGLRHTFATLANHAGDTMFNISKTLGHSTVATTSNIYTHLLDDSHAATVERVAESLHAQTEAQKHKAE